MADYVPSSQKEVQEMLDFVGVSSIDELYSMVPDDVYRKEVDIPSGKSEMQVLSAIEKMGKKNVLYSSCFRGAGAYRHFIPSIVKTVVGKEGFRTTYTPYQAEISQGVLQSIFEFQTMISELTGMDVANASVYDGAAAAAESLFMCLERKKTKMLVSSAVHPQILDVMETYCKSRDVPLVLIPTKDGKTDAEALKELMTPDVAGVYFQSPNFYGIVEDGDTLVALAHEGGAKAIMGVNPISLGLLKTPGEYGADIAVGEGQPLGMPLSFGGPYLGFMCTTEKMVRKLPGRIAGETTDHDGNRAFVLTLQAREQHIRREKASSNVCSNQALCAMASAVYMAAMGPKGMKDVATQCYAKAHYLQGELAKIGFAPVYDAPFFHEFVTTSPIPASEVEEKLAKKGILGGLPVKEGILWCATELNTKEDIDELISALKGDE